MKLQKVGALLEGIAHNLEDSLKAGDGKELRQIGLLFREFGDQSISDFTTTIKEVQSCMRDTSLTSNKEFVKFIADVSARLHRFPGQCPKDFVRFVDDAFSSQHESVPMIIERMNKFRLGTGEPFDDLKKSINKLKANDAKTVLKNFNLAPEKSVGDNRRKLLDHLQADTDSSSGQFAQSNGMSTQARGTPIDTQVKDVVRYFESVEKSLKSLGYQEIEQKGNWFYSFDRDVLVEAARRLQLTTLNGSKAEIANELTRTLRKQKEDLEQISHI